MKYVVVAYAPRVGALSDRADKGALAARALDGLYTSIEDARQMQEHFAGRHPDCTVVVAEVLP